MIPVFDPAQDDLTVERWVEFVDKLAQQYEWDERSIMRLLAGRLQGHARTWYDTTRRVTATWTDTKESLIQLFRKLVPFNKLFKDAANYESTPGQSLGDYCFQKLSKIRLLNITMPDNYIIDLVIGGITNENIARTIRSAQHADANSLYTFMNTIGAIPAKNTFLKTVPNSKSREYSHKSGTSGAPAKVEPKTESQTKTRPVTCFNCNKTGHIAKNCFKPRVQCTGCRRLGHESDRCPSTKNACVVAAPSDPKLNIYEQTVYINDHKINGLIDTASVCTILRSSLVTRFELSTRTTTTVALRGFSGHLVHTDKIAHIKLRVQDVTADVDALVVPNEYLTRDIIVGRDFLDQDHIVMIKKQHQLLFKTITNTADVFVIVDEEEPNGEFDFGDITAKERQDSMKLLEEYGDRITKSLQNLGKTNTAYLAIRCMTDAPVTYHPYRMAETEKAVLREMIKELLDNQIIRDSHSLYASPIILIKKRTGGFRLCIDYRRLNAITIKDRYPLPLIDDQLDRLGGNRYFTALDLASGYYQVPVEETSIPKTAFITPEGHYEFLRMPFGLTNAPAVFQRLMDLVLGPLKNTIAYPYLDDIIIPSKSVEEGLQHLRRVLDKFREHNLTLKISKCSFFKSRIDYLGREVSAERVRPGEGKVRALSQLPAPATVKQIRQFLGLASYFRKFIQGYATLVEPLTRLTRKNEP